MKKRAKTNKEREQVLRESTGISKSDNNLGMFYGCFFNGF